jgi:hypothetical protein
LNSGICVNTALGFQCLCPVAYTSPTCSILISPCLSQPCVASNTLNCTSNTSAYTCYCRTGFTGETETIRTEMKQNGFGFFSLRQVRPVRKARTRAPPCSRRARTAASVSIQPMVTRANATHCSREAIVAFPSIRVRAIRVWHPIPSRVKLPSTVPPTVTVVLVGLVSLVRSAWSLKKRVDIEISA